MKRAVATFSLNASILLGSCATPISPDAYYAAHPRCTKGTSDHDADKACLAIPEVHQYVEHMQKRVHNSWRLPQGVPAFQQVHLRFRLQLDGSFQCLSLSLNSELALSRSALSAVQRVIPLDPLPPEAECLTRVLLVAN